MNKNNQPGCPPRLASYDMSLEHKITNQYINNSQNQSSIYNHSVLMPVKGGSTYSNISQSQNNYYSSINRPNQTQNFQSRIPQQRISVNNGDISMQPIKNYVQPLSNNHNINIINPNLNNSQYSDFNNNFYQNNNQSKKLNFFNVISNLKSIFKQSKLSKWTLIFIILQVIVIVTLETLLFINNKYFHDKFMDINEKHKKPSSIFDKNYNQSKSVMIYHIIFIIAQIFVLVIYYDSFRISSSVQLITVSIFNFIIAGYSFYQIFQAYFLFKDISNTDEIKNSKDDELRFITSTSKYTQYEIFFIKFYCLKKKL